MLKPTNAYNYINSHAYILEKKKSSFPPSMESQTHLTLGKKRRKENEPIVSLHELSD